MSKELAPVESRVLFYTTADGAVKVEVLFQDETFWLSQKRMAELFGVDVRTISEHLQNIFKSGELDEDSVIRKFRITATDGKVTAEIAKAHAEAEFEKYRVVQDRLYESDFDRVVKAIEPKEGDA